MLEIVIDDDYSFYANGLKAILHDLFFPELDDGTLLCNNSIADDISTADIIIKSFSMGEICTCQPLFRSRKHNSLLIGLYDENQNPDFSPLPLCIRDILYIKRSESLAVVKRTILEGWFKSQQCSRRHFSCAGCRHRTLSSQQANVATLFFLEESVESIARIMKISTKTVCAHKRILMKNFHLKSDQDLLYFLNKLNGKLHTPNIFSERLSTLRRTKESLRET